MPEQSRTGRVRPTSMFSDSRPPPSNFDSRRTSFSIQDNRSIDARVRRAPTLHSTSTFHELRAIDPSLPVSNSTSNTAYPTPVKNVTSRIRPSSFTPGLYRPPRTGNIDSSRLSGSIQDNHNVAPRLQRAPTFSNRASFESSRRDNNNRSSTVTESRSLYTAANRSYPKREQNSSITDWADAIAPGPPPSNNDSRRSSLSIQTDQSTIPSLATVMSTLRRRRDNGHIRTQSIPVIPSDRNFPDPWRRRITSLNSIGSSVYSRGSRQEVEQGVTEQKKQLERWEMRQKFKRLKERLDTFQGNNFPEGCAVPAAAFQPERELPSLPPNPLDVYVAAPLLLGPGIDPKVGYGPEESNIATLGGEMQKLHLRPNSNGRLEAMRREFFQLNGQRVKMLGKAQDRGETLSVKDLGGDLMMQEVEACEELIEACDARLPKPEGLRGLQWVFDVGLKMDIDSERYVNQPLDLG
jgi:hypothetical protein